MQEKNRLLFKALGEETKYRILELLVKGEGCQCEKGKYCACEIPSIIKRTQSNTSMHLAKLQEWGLVKSRREGKKMIYSIKDRRIYDILKVLKKVS